MSLCYQRDEEMEEESGSSVKYPEGRREIGAVKLTDLLVFAAGALAVAR
jgi:hypothetical protein